MPTETNFNPLQVITGSATLYQGAVGATLPVVPATAGGLYVPDPSIWTALGYTDAGVKISYNPTNKDVDVDEEMAPLDVLLTGEKLTVSCGLAEVTLANLNRVMSTGTLNTATAAGASTAGSQVFTVGSQQTTKKFAYLIIGNGPNGFPRAINIYKAVATANVDMTYKRGEKIMIPAEFTALAYSANAAGNRLMQIIDKQANGTS